MSIGAESDRVWSMSRRGSKTTPTLVGAASLDGVALGAPGLEELSSRLCVTVRESHCV